jgi:hypothetical protein
LIEEGATEPLIWLKVKNPEVEAEPSIEKDRCSWIIDFRKLAYRRNHGLIFETLEAWIMK